MISVLMVKVPVYQVIDVIAVRHGFMTALGPVLMFLNVPSAIVAIGAIGWIGRRDLQRVFIDVAVMDVVQMAVVQVVDVIVVPDRGVSAFFPVFVCMVLVSLMICHCGIPFCS